MEYMVGNGNQLDTSIEIVTPENIAFRYHVAGPFRRLPAYLIDFVIRIVLVAVLIIGLLFPLGAIGLGSAAMGLGLAGCFVVEWFYGGLFETFWNGQTPGKRLMGIRVVSIDGQPINGWQAVLRNFLRMADAQPFYFFQVGLLAAMLNDRFQRLGDLAASTMVVVEQRHWFKGMVHFAEPEVARLAALVPPNYQVNRTLGLALAAYVERRPMFAWARRLEIARHLAEPLRQRFGLPPNTDPDLLLCALYQRSFLGIPGGNGAPPVGAAVVPAETDPLDPLAWLREISQVHAGRGRS
jgi:uncharacterized RDD family membrane protein YckC